MAWFDNNPDCKFAKKHGFDWQEWDKGITTEKLLEIVKHDDVVVEKCEESTNNYGEYLFVTVVDPKMESRYTFYGAGYNWNRERHIHNKWSFYSGNIGLYKGKSTNKQYAIKDILNADRHARLEAKDDQPRKAYEKLADLYCGDEDALNADLEEAGVDAEEIMV